MKTSFTHQRNKIMPKMFIVWMVFCGFAGIATLFFVVSKCGAKGLLYGNGAVYVAASGMCDK
jgi:hypothetical protein